MWKNGQNIEKPGKHQENTLKTLKRRKTGKKPSKISEKRQKSRTTGKNRRKCWKKMPKMS